MNTYIHLALIMKAVLDWEVKQILIYVVWGYVPHFMMISPINTVACTFPHFCLWANMVNILWIFVIEVYGRHILLFLCEYFFVKCCLILPKLNTSCYISEFHTFRHSELLVVNRILVRSWQYILTVLGRQFLFLRIIIEKQRPSPHIAKIKWYYTLSKLIFDLSNELRDYFFLNRVSCSRGVCHGLNGN